MTRQGRRLGALAAGALALLAAAALAAWGLRDSVAFFRTPSEVLETPPPEGRALSLGGLVELGSLRGEDGALVFRLADDVASVEVRYAGPVPDLFREGQCVVARGVFEPDGGFRARQVLAKHDETYQPREIASAPRLATSCGAAART